MSDYSSKKLIRKMDCADLFEREERREQARKAEAQQKPQRVDGAAAARRGIRSYLEESYRQIDLQKLKERDPAEYFFRVANSRHYLT